VKRGVSRRREEGAHRRTHRRIVPRHDELDQPADVRRGKGLVVEQRVELGPRLNPVEGVLLLLALLGPAGEEIEQERVVVKLDVVVLRSDLTDKGER
jgi:hypothetical protein